MQVDESESQETSKTRSEEAEAGDHTVRPSMLESVTEFGGDVVTAIYDGRFPDDQSRDDQRLPGWAQEIRDQAGPAGHDREHGDLSSVEGQLDAAQQYEADRQADQNRSNHL